MLVMQHAADAYMRPGSSLVHQPSLFTPRVETQQEQQNQGDRRDDEKDDGHRLVLLLPADVPRCALGSSSSSSLQLIGSKYQQRGMRRCACFSICQG
jgi:hypothetical protein